LGIPILTTGVGWALDKLDFCDAMFADKDLKDLNDSIKYIMEHNNLEDLRQNARRVIDNWTLQDYINKHKEIYEM